MLPTANLSKYLQILLTAGLILGSGCRHEADPEPLLANSNVLLVLVDTLRADHLGAYGHHLATSPFIDRLATESIIFDRVLAPASQTVPSTLSLLTGVYPSRHGNQYFVEEKAFRVPTPETRPQVPDHVTLLSEKFRELGYTTGAIVTNPWLKPDWGFARGFDTYDHLGAGHTQDFPRGNEVNKAAWELLRNRKDDPFFLYLHFMDVHMPYEESPRYESEFPNDLSPIPSTAVLLSGYNAEIRAMDDYFRDVIAMLRDLGLDEKTLVIFTSDHGEEFGEHHAFGHGQALYEELVRVPLLMWHSKLKTKARRVDAAVSLVDVAPTILELVFGSTASDGDGISLAPLIGETPLFDHPCILCCTLGYPTATDGDGAALAAIFRETPPSDETRIVYNELGYQTAADGGADSTSLAALFRETPPSDRPRILYSELGYQIAAVRRNEKLIRSSGGKTKGQWAFDLAADPKEKNAVESEQSWIQELSAAVDNHAARRFVDDKPKDVIDPATAERVRALGY